MSNLSEHFPGWALSPFTVPQLFEQQVADDPNAVAIESSGRQWSYLELSTFANCVANRLLRSGLVPGDLVAISALRSPEMIASVLGVLKAGAAYVPLDASYPDERLRFMLADTKAAFLIADETCAARLTGNMPERCQAIPLSSFPDEATEPVSLSGNPSDLLCIIYTSGSTGTPKGVMIEQQGVTRLVIDPDYVSIAPADVFIHLAPLSFDTSLFEIFGALLNGARVVVLPPSVNQLIGIAEAVQQFRVTTMWLTSGLFSALIDECPSVVQSLRQLVVGGDVVSVPHARKALAAMKEGCLIDGYGPTENTTFSTCHRVCPEDLQASAIPVGRPINGSGASILNENRQPVKAGEGGELYVTGAGLARGYWNRPDLTSERFFEIETEPGRMERGYKTGDLARYRADGSIDFLGRIDTQVKIRGFRIELTEIELAMAASDKIAASVVVAVPVGAAGDKNLRLCYVLKKGARLTAGEAEQFLRDRLPAYLVPNEYLELAALPLDPNGKVNRKSLAHMELPAETKKDVAAPRVSPIETELLGMLRDLLKSPKVSADDDFFLVGGHSLLAARLFAQIEARYGRRLPLALMLQVRTIRSLAAVVATPDAYAAWSSLVPLRTGGSASPVFLLHAIGGNVIGYQDLASRLPGQFPIYALQAEGLDGVTKMPETLEVMAANYVAQIRNVQPQGPYYLCGFSAGGVIAFEMARQLENTGQQVGLIGLIDSNLNYSLLAVARQRGALQSLVQASHVLRWNLWYSTQIGLGNFLQKKFRNVRLNARIAWFALQCAARSRNQTGDPMRLSVEEAFIRAIRQYDPEPVHARAILFRTADSALYDPNQERAWRHSIQGDLQVCTVPGTHETMLEVPNIDVLAAEFARALESARIGLEKKQGATLASDFAMHSKVDNDNLRLEAAPYPSAG